MRSHSSVPASLLRSLGAMDRHDGHGCQSVEDLTASSPRDDVDACPFSGVDVEIGLLELETVVFPEAAETSLARSATCTGPEFKRCPGCPDGEKLQPVTQFRKRAASRDGLQTYCKTCQDAQNKGKRERDPAVRERAKDQNARRIIENQIRLALYLRGKQCRSCPECDPRALQFDHRDPAEKAHNVGDLVSRGYAWATIEAEIAKCDIVCASCHQKHTVSQQGWIKGRIVEIIATLSPGQLDEASVAVEECLRQIAVMAAAA